MCIHAFYFGQGQSPWQGYVETHPLSPERLLRARKSEVWSCGPAFVGGDQNLRTFCRELFEQRSPLSGFAENETIRQYDPFSFRSNSRERLLWKDGHQAGSSTDDGWNTKCAGRCWGGCPVNCFKPGHRIWEFFRRSQRNHYNHATYAEETKKERCSSYTSLLVLSWKGGKLSTFDRDSVEHVDEDTVKITLLPDEVTPFKS